MIYRLYILYIGNISVILHGHNVSWYIIYAMYIMYIYKYICVFVIPY